MPHILSKIIKKDSPGLWGEGSPYSTNTIYDIHHQTDRSPPVQYDEWFLWKNHDGEIKRKFIFTMQS